MKIIIETNIETEMSNAGRNLWFLKIQTLVKPLLRYYERCPITVRSWGFILTQLDPTHDSNMGRFIFLIDQWHYSFLYKSGSCIEKHIKEILLKISLKIDSLCLDFEQINNYHKTLKLIWLKKIFREIKEKSADKKCGQVQSMVFFVCSFSLAFIWPDNFFP